ncbi:MAG: DUF2993 domain-containing protein, partial [Actinomycetota bacterium]|nr:DUF2993 domain-containing protein [Actinomycetota bacterium]
MPTVTSSIHRPRRVALIVVIAVLVVVTCVGVAAEAYVRHRVTSCLASSVSVAIGGSVDIGLSRKPVLLSLLDKKVPYLTVDSDHAALGPVDGPQLTDLRIRSRFNGVHLPGSDGRGGYLDSSAATIDWPASSIGATVRSQPFGALITQVGADAGTLRVQFLGGLGSINLRPVVEAGHITIRTVDARVLGFGVPAT